AQLRVLHRVLVDVCVQRDADVRLQQRVRDLDAGVPDDLRRRLCHGEIPRSQRRRGQARKEGGDPVSDRATDSASSSSTAPAPALARAGAGLPDDDEVIRAPRWPLGPRIGTYIGAVLILIWGLAPFYWMLVTSLRDNRLVFSSNPVPSNFTMENFAEALSREQGNN